MLLSYTFIYCNLHILSFVTLTVIVGSAFEFQFTYFLLKKINISWC